MFLAYLLHESEIFWFVLIFSENFKLFGHNCLVFIMLSLRLINIQKTQQNLEKT